MSVERVRRRSLGTETNGRVYMLTAKLRCHAHPAQVCFTFSALVGVLCGTLPVTSESYRSRVLNKREAAVGKHSADAASGCTLCDGEERHINFVSMEDKSAYNNVFHRNILMK